MNVYQSKERRIRMADRRVKTPMATIGGTRAGLDNNYRDMLYVADRRAKTTDDLTEGCPIEPPNPSDTAELLKKYRAALITAYELGKLVKEAYNIVPPKAIIDIVRHAPWDGPAITIGLTVN
jgi:hypothetical protein